MALFNIKDLNYPEKEKLFKHFNLEIEEGDYISLVGPNGCGKTLLTKIISAIIPTYDYCQLDGISLNKENVFKYMKEIGIVSNEFNNLFIYKKVKDELKYPLLNLGMSESNINKSIEKYTSFFEVEDILSKDIKELDLNLKSIFIIILSLIHNPKLLVLDDAFNDMDSKTMNFVLKKLKILNDEGLTILNITSKLDTIYNSNKIMTMNNFKIDKSFKLDEFFKEDSYIKKMGLEIPLVVDLSLKLISYGLLDKIYYDLLELEKNLWK